MCIRDRRRSDRTDSGMALPGRFEQRLGCRGARLYRPHPRPGLTGARSGVSAAEEAVVVGQAGGSMTFPAFLQLGIQVSQGGELAGEFGLAGSLHLAARGKVAAAEQVGCGNHRRSHGTVLVGALRPREIVIHPKIEAHGPYGTSSCASCSTASSSSSLRNGLRNTRQAGNCNANSGSGFAAM